MKRTLIDALNQPTQKQPTKRLFCMDLEESEYEKLIKTPLYKENIELFIKNLIS